MPAIALSPIPLRLKQWQVVYDLGKLVSPTVSAASGVAWAVAAWASYGRNNSLDWKLYAAAGLATFSILPYTVVVLMPTNKELMKRAKIAGDMEHVEDKFAAESEEVLATWSTLSNVRVVLPMVGAWFGLYAALK